MEWNFIITLCNLIKQFFNVIFCWKFFAIRLNVVWCWKLLGKIMKCILIYFVDILIVDVAVNIEKFFHKFPSILKLIQTPLIKKLISNSKNQQFSLPKTILKSYVMANPPKSPEIISKLSEHYFFSPHELLWF
jgi:hypothetical protein